MVKNTGETGGGPFRVKDADGTISIQIVEKPQINLNDKTQQTHFSNSAFFNPTDLVCSVKNYKGNKFNLAEFTRPDTCFITQKTIKGEQIKAFEHPGLWNGGMYYWNSIFVEVPVITFNPVKSIFDLLNPAHQNN